MLTNDLNKLNFKDNPEHFAKKIKIKITPREATSMFQSGKTVS